MVCLKTKDIEVEIDGKKEKITIKRFGWGELNKLYDEVTETKIVDGRTVANVNVFKLQNLALLKGIVKAPFPITQESIDSLDPKAGEEIFKRIDEFNLLTGQKKTR